MSPLYRYECVDPECGHVHEEIRKYLARRRPAVCPDCGQRAHYIISAHHQAVDGIYSYAANVGNPELVEKGQARERGEVWDTLANPKRPEE
jgi:putative FmdB family regulatory protein